MRLTPAKSFSVSQGSLVNIAAGARFVVDQHRPSPRFVHLPGQRARSWIDALAGGPFGEPSLLREDARLWYSFRQALAGEALSVKLGSDPDFEAPLALTETGV